MDTHMAEIAELQEQLMAKSDELSELCARNDKLADELSRVKTQNCGWRCPFGIFGVNRW